MAKIEKYEDWRCWQQARILVNEVYQIAQPLQSLKEFTLADQLKRAAISVMTNIAEGFNRYHKKDVIRFLNYAQSSSQEVKSFLYIVMDQKFAPTNEVEKIQANCEHCQALILGLLKHIKKTLHNDETQSNEPEQAYDVTNNDIDTTNS